MTAVCTTIEADTPDGGIAATRTGPSRTWQISTPWRTPALVRSEPETPEQIRGIMRKMVGFWYPEEAKSLVFETRTVGDTAEDIFAVTEADKQYEAQYRAQMAIIATRCAVARQVLSEFHGSLWPARRTAEGRRLIRLMSDAAHIVCEAQGSALKESGIE